MIYNIEFEEQFNTEFDVKDIYKRVVDTVLEYFGCPYDCEINLLFVNNDEIKEINNETRGIDAPTDVLSFPNIEFEKEGNFDSFDESQDCFEPDTGELILGDIVLSVDKIISQANEYGHSILREYAFLICHSMLHLIGFDHIEEDDRKVMEKYQEDIMNILNINR